MKKKRSLMFLSVLTGVLGVSFYLIFFSPSKARVSNEAYVQIPVKFTPFINTPIIEVEIEGSKYSLELDLGCPHYLCLSADVLEKIKNREILDPVDSFDMNGNEYHLSGFRIPKINIENNLKIEGAIAREENRDFLLHGSQILPDIPFLHRTIAKLYMAATDGRIGWSLFKQMNCFFDFSNSVMYVAKDMRSLQESAGFSIGDFAKTSFDLKNGGVVLSIETDLGIKRFLLDSGSTWSLFKRSQVKGMRWAFITDKFQVGESDFGRSKFWLYGFSDRIEIDGVLGIDFFEKHAICLDFHNQVAYIKPNQTLREKFMAWMSDSKTPKMP